MAGRDGQDRMLGLLRVRGLIAAGELVKELGISRATLSRYLQGVSSPWVAVGKTRNLQYGLLRPLADLSGELPLFRVDEAGRIRPMGKLLILHGGFCVVEPGAQVFEAMPPEISDVAPQGFMGRAFAARHAAELGLPPRLGDWSDDHVLKAVARRGEDFAGNLIVGTDSAERWMKLDYREVKRSRWFDLSRFSYDEQPAGSSAGGEQPKFSVVIGGAHKLVKFAGPLRDTVWKRWRDLLHCEAIAARILSKSGIAAANSEVSERDGVVFLEVERFDRIGVKGRRPCLSLAAADGFHFGDRDDWAAAAARLQRGGFLAEADARKIRLIEAFARLIGDTDRHFYNIGLFPRFSSAASLAPERYELAPVFDKLPMLFAPVEGRVLEREYSPPLPGADLIEVWPEAVELAENFWDKVSKENSLSAGFRQIAKNCLKALMA